MNVARKAKKSSDGFFTDQDTFLFKEGSHFRLYEKLGAHLMMVNDTPGVQFAVWAPNASQVSVIGDFNGWDQQSHPLQAKQDGSGIWQGFIAGLAPGTGYKYQIVSQFNNYQAAKGDPFAYYWENIPQAGSIVWDLNYQWQDQQWMADRYRYNALTTPFSIYEVHLGSWRRKALDGTTFINYREIADYLGDYVKEMGFTHVEILPVMEHPFYGSWGPGKKLIFMGGEFGQWQEWNHDRSLDWQLLQYPAHRGIQQWVRDLNYLYQSEPALHTYDFQSSGFEWIDYCDWENSVVAFLRKCPAIEDTLVIICNFTPVTHYNYRIGVPAAGVWQEVLNSDASTYQGSGQGNLDDATTTPTASQGRENTITITLPPLAILFFKQLDTNALAGQKLEN